MLDRQPDRRKLVAGEPVTALRGGQVVRQEAGITGRLGQAIAVADRKSETQLKPPRCLPQQRPCAADEAAEPGQVLRGGILIRVHQKLEQGGHDADAGDAKPCQVAPEPRGLELSAQDRPAFEI